MLKAALRSLMGVGRVLPVLLLPMPAVSQEITYLSNLTEPEGIINSVAANNRELETFKTGPAAGGYVLNSVQLKAGAAGNPAGSFLVHLDRDNVPVARLTGPNPSGYGT